MTTDNMREGVTNLYFTETRVTDTIMQQKGQPDGLAPLDNSGKVPANHLPTLSVGNTFSGLDADKTNPLTYPTL